MDNETTIVDDGKGLNVKTKSLTVTIDTTVEDIIKSDQSGKTLYFTDDVTKFKRLTKEELQALSKPNKDRYLASFGLYKMHCEERENPSPTKGLSTHGRRLEPRSRFHVFEETKEPGVKYSWVTPDKLYNVEMNGGRVVTRETDPTLRFTGGVVDSDGTPKIGVAGRTEQILVRYPKELYKKNIEDPPAILSQKRNMTYEETSKTALDQKDGQAFVSKDDDEKGWRELG